jgi:hypothetical protein
VYLVQLLLPLADNTGWPLPEEEFTRTAHELAERFGGVTAYSRSPAHGFWNDNSSKRAKHDDVIVYEVMTPRLSIRWWKSKRAELEKRFGQKVIVIRCSEVRII